LEKPTKCRFGRSARQVGTQNFTIQLRLLSTAVIGILRAKSLPAVARRAKIRENAGKMLQLIAA
jgi:hypothetical protein